MSSFHTFISLTFFYRLGNGLLFFLLPLSIYRESGSVFSAIISTSIQTVPYLTAPLAGALIDSLDRKRLAIYSELVQGISVLLLAFMFDGALTPLIAILLLILGTASIFSRIIGEYKVIPILLDGERLEKGFSIYNSSIQAGHFSGPLIAGFALSFIGANMLILANAVTFFLMALFLFHLDFPATNLKGILKPKALIEGFEYVWSHHKLRMLTISLTVYNLGVGSLVSAATVLFLRDLSFEPALVGIVISSASVAAIGGSVGSNWFFPEQSIPQRLKIAFVLITIASIGLVFGNPIVVVVTYVTVFAFEGVLNVQTASLRVQLIDDEYVGRANGVIRTFLISVVPVSALFFSYTTEAFGLFALLPAPIFLTVAAITWGVQTEVAR